MFRTFIRHTTTTLLFLLAASSISAQEIVDSICAVIDDEIILESEVGYGVNSILLERGLRRPTEEQLSEARRQVLRAYISQKALLAKAEDETLTVEDRVVDKELDKKFEQVLQQVGGEEKLAEYFSRPVRQVKREMRRGVRESLLIDMVKRQKLGTAQIRRQDVIDFYNSRRDELPGLPERIEVAHILLPVAPSEEAREAARGKIEEAMKALEAGSEFDSIAVRYSDDPSSANGGRLGFTSRGDLVPEYEEAAYPLEEGAISGIVESRYGFHIIRLVERQGERISTQHILAALSPTENDWLLADSLAGVIRELCLSGDSFSEMAKQYSTDDASKGKGGLLETMPLEQLPEEFRGAAEGLAEGELTQPFRTSFGVHLAKIVKRYPARDASLEEDWQALEQYALAVKREEQFQNWMKTELADHYISPEELRRDITGR